MFSYSKKMSLCSLVVSAFLLLAINACSFGAKSNELQDSDITARVQKVLLEDKAFKLENVIVTTSGGEVQLSGFVISDEQKERAEKLAEKTEGVKEVRNDIVVKK